jgi:hypothetical protein
VLLKNVKWVVEEKMVDLLSHSVLGCDYWVGVDDGLYAVGFLPEPVQIKVISGMNIRCITKYKDRIYLLEDSGSHKSLLSFRKMDEFVDDFRVDKTHLPVDTVDQMHIINGLMFTVEHRVDADRIVVTPLDKSTPLYYSQLSGLMGNVTSFTAQDGMFYILSYDAVLTESKIYIFTDVWECVHVYDLNSMGSFMYGKCQNVIVKGHTIHFTNLDGYMCRLNMISKKITHEVIHSSIKSPLGLSINGSTSQDVVVGHVDVSDAFALAKFRDDSDDISFLHLTDCFGSKQCFITDISGEDFNQMDSSMKISHVQQISNVQHPKLSKLLDNQYKTLDRFAYYYSHGFQEFFEQYMRQDNAYFSHKNIAWNPQTMAEYANIPAEIVADPVAFTQYYLKRKTKFTISNGTIDSLKDKFGVFDTEFVQLVDDGRILQDAFVNSMQHDMVSVMNPVGIFPPDSGMGWHTNLNEKQIQFRMYLVSKVGGSYGSSFFMYRHGYSGEVHIVPDRVKCINIFSFRDMNSPLFHAVCCGSHTFRVSQGFSMTNEVLESLGLGINVEF